MTTTDTTTDPLALYASNPLFRSATVDELVVQGNPYRRPVRPDDLRILDYRTPVERSRVFHLKSLIAHRLLLNVNESELVFLPPPGAGHSVWDDFGSFYSPENRARGRAARPILEASVFGFLADTGAPVEGFDAAALRDHVAAAVGQHRQAGSPAAGVIAGLEDRERAAKMYLIQRACTSLIGPSVVARGLLGQPDALRLAAAARLSDGGSTDEGWPLFEQAHAQALLTSCGLEDQPHAYWQFYLASSMALANYLHLVARGGGELFWFLGALVHRHVVARTRAAQEAELLRDVFGPAADLRLLGSEPSGTELDGGALHDRLVKPIVDRCGDHVAGGLAVGFEHMRALQAVADEDLTTQVTWADRRPEYQERARRIYDVIQRERIQVDLETFVESWEETSTTHVHDTERLLVIESGVMDFWNRPDERIEFHPGDVMLVPDGRLHGSTVTSGQCVYHQPIITPEVNALVDRARQDLAT